MEKITTSPNPALVSFWGRPNGKEKPTFLGFPSPWEIRIFNWDKYI